MAKKNNNNKEDKEKAAAAREARKAKAEKDTFVYVNEPESKLPPQAQGIVNILKEKGKKGLSRKDLIDAMTGTIETRQPVGRILTYYQKRLVECGAVKIETKE